MLNPKKSITTRRLTPEQLKEVFTPAKKSNKLEEGLMSKQGLAILGDKYIPTNKIKDNNKLSERQKRKLIREQVTAKRRRAFHDYWAALSHVPAADSLPQQHDTGGGATGEVGKFIIGEDFEIGK